MLRTQRFEVRDRIGHFFQQTCFALLVFMTAMPWRAQAQAASDADVVPVVPSRPDAAPLLDVREDAPPLDVIEVTGSRIRRTDYETAQPVLSISRGDIERSGVTSIAELLQRLVIAGSSSNTSVSNNELGTIEVSLRNLGSQRTLVLVNGRRWVGGMFYYSTSSVDLSTIPLAIIERVEVLKDGASAIYGSDAVAGVVNIITRKDYAGRELRAQAGGFSQGDGLSQDYSLSWGGQMENTSAFLNLSYGQAAEILNGDRAITRYFRYGVGPTRGLLFTPRGTLNFVPTQQNGQTLGQELCPTDPASGTQFCNMILQRGQTITGDPSENTASVASRYEPFNSTSLDPDVNDLFDDNSVRDLSYPSNQISLFAALHHSFGDVSLQGEFLYGRRHVKHSHFAYLAEIGDFASDQRFQNIFIAADNPYNPFDQDIGKADAQGAGGGVLLEAFPDLTPHIFVSTVESYRGGLGLDGSYEALGRVFDWQAGLVYAESRNQASWTLLRLDHLGLALGPIADCNAAPGCVPLNILGGPGATTPAMLDYITYPASYPKQQRLTDAYLTLSNDLFALPAGTVKAAYGAEYRKETYADFPDALIVSCVGDACFPPTSGGFDVKEGFLELSVPLLSERPMAQQLDLSLALRRSDYDTAGGDTTYKLGLRWKPVDSLLLRATRSTAFRAPAISDLYLSSSTFVFSGLSDPCSDYAGEQGGAAAPATVQDNCRNAGVPTSYVQPASWVGHDGGNRNLGPESADTYTAGLVFSPIAMPDLSFYLDWYRIELQDSISLLDPQFVLDSCYQTPGGTNTCALISRDPQTGSMTDQRYQPLNIGANHVEGVDFGAAYRLPDLWQMGEFKLSFDASYLTENAVLLADATGQEQKTGQQGRETATNAFPRLKANAGLEWLRGAWKASWSLRYIHHMTEACDDGIVPTLTELGVCSRPNPGDPSLSENELRSVVYHDVQVGYSNQPWGAEFTAGVRNLFDQKPPASYTNAYNAFDAATYDLPGVFSYLAMKLSF